MGGALSPVNGDVAIAASLDITRVHASKISEYLIHIFTGSLDLISGVAVESWSFIFRELLIPPPLISRPPPA
jgi:hypothetical protein